MPRKLIICLLGTLVTALLSCVRAAAPPPMVGGYTNASVTDKDVVAAARFAVKEQQQVMRQNKETARVRLTLVKIEAAQRQVVAGLKFKLDLKVRVDEETQNAQAIVDRNLSHKLELTSWKWKP